MGDQSDEVLKNIADPQVMIGADEHDVWSLYNLVLRRDPESRQVINARVGQPIFGIFTEFVSSAEFRQHILPAVMAKTSADALYKGTQSFGELLTWAESRLPLSAGLREGLFHARSWAEHDEILFGSDELLNHFPFIREAGAKRALELNRLGNEGISETEIRGALDYASVWEVRGWCADTKNLSKKPTIDVFVDNDLLGSVTCAHYRRDVHEKLGGDGRCGFSFIMPAKAQDLFQTERRLTVRERSSGVLIGSPVLVRGDLPSRVDAVESVQGELARAKGAIATLERRVAQLAADFGYPIQAYDEYARAFDQVSPQLAEQYRRNLMGIDFKPTISIVLLFELDNKDLVEITVQTIQGQIYPATETVIVGTVSSADVQTAAQISGLCKIHPGTRLHTPRDAENLRDLIVEGLSKCDGEYVIFLRAGDRLEPDALYHNVLRLQRRGTKAVYADEDCYCIADNEIRRHSPRLKPDLDMDYLLSGNYIGKFVLFERATLKQVKYPRQGGGAEELDLLLRFIEIIDTNDILHVPYVLYHSYEAGGHSARLDDQFSQALCRVINGHFNRIGLAAKAEPFDDAPGNTRRDEVRLRWPLPEMLPSASIILLSKDHPELVGPCIASLLATTREYRGEVEFLVVDNGTTDLIASRLLRNLRENGTIRTIDYLGPFNWSKMNNHAAGLASGEVLLFLNNDLLAIREGWLEELLSQAIRPQVGAVGARLLYPDDTIQHAGIVLGVNGSTCHEAVGEPLSDGGYLSRSRLQRRASAITGACLATRKEVFASLRGFDELAFRVTYNDIDYCLKAAANGYDIIYTPVATLHHFESVSRGFDSARFQIGTTDEELATFRARWPKALREDPLYNPLFSRTARPFAYLTASRRH